jgi:hypothetical protein
MRRFKWALVLALAAFVSMGVTTAVADAPSITGFPNEIRKVDLVGYKLVTSYPLGTNTGNTFQQTYLHNGRFSAVGLAGPFTGQTFSANYVAMPVAHKLLMVTWYTDAGTLVDVFVMNFTTGIVSDVAPGPSPPSLGTVQIMKQGENPIP